MRARELAMPYPMVSIDEDAAAAARRMATEGLPGLIVVGRDGRPWTVLPGSQVLRFVVPEYVQQDPGLARALDADSADDLCRRLIGRTVGELLPPRSALHELPVVDADATSLEIAAVMARMHSPIVAVIEGDRVLGAVTVSRLLAHLLPDAPAT